MSLENLSNQEIGTGTKRAHPDLLSPKVFDLFYFRLRIEPVHGPVVTEKDKFKRSAPGDSAHHARPARDEVDVPPDQRHIRHRRGHQDQFYIQILLSKVAFLLSDDHRQHGLAERRNRHLNLPRARRSRRTNQENKYPEHFPWQLLNTHYSTRHQYFPAECLRTCIHCSKECQTYARSHERACAPLHNAILTDNHAC